MGVARSGLWAPVEDFFATVRKKDGQDYQSNSLGVMVTSIDRSLKEQLKVIIFQETDQLPG